MRAHVLITMLDSSLPPVVCMRAHVLLTIFVCMSCFINDVWFIFTSSCLYEGSCFINDVRFIFTPVVCMRAHVL